MARVLVTEQNPQETPVAVILVEPSRSCVEICDDQELFEALSQPDILKYLEQSALDDFESRGTVTPYVRREYKNYNWMTLPEV